MRHETNSCILILISFLNMSVVPHQAGRSTFSYLPRAVSGNVRVAPGYGSPANRLARGLAGGATAYSIYDMGRRAYNYVARGGKRRRVGSHTHRRRRAVRAGQGITNQYDRTTIYRKKRMPRFRRRRFRRFSRKVNFVSEKDLGTRTYVRNFQETMSQTPNTQNTLQGIGEICLYPVDGPDAFNRELTDLANDETELDPTGKFLFQSGVLDVTIRNDSIDETTTPVACELDIYHIRASKSFEPLVTGGSVAAKNLLGVFQKGASDTSLIGGAGSEITLDRRGITPWDLPQSLSMYGVKILKKTKYQLSAGQVCTYQIRDPRRHVVDKSWIANHDSQNWRGVTQFLLLIFRNVPGTSVGENARFRLQIGMTKKYMYKIKQSTTDKDRMNGTV